MYRGKINKEELKKHKRKISTVGLDFALVLNIDTRTFSSDKLSRFIRRVADIICAYDLDLQGINNDIEQISGFEEVLPYILHIKNHHIYYRNEIYLSCCESIGQDTVFYFGKCEY